MDAFLKSTTHLECYSMGHFANNKRGAADPRESNVVLPWDLLRAVRTMRATGDGFKSLEDMRNYYRARVDAFL